MPTTTNSPLPRSEREGWSPGADSPALAVRLAHASDVGVGVLLGRELHGATAAIDWLPCDDEKVRRLARSWLTSRDFLVLVAEDTEPEDRWPTSLSAMAESKTAHTVGFFVGYRHRAAARAPWLAHDVAMFVRPGDYGAEAAARMILRFKAWAQQRRCAEMVLGSAAGFIVRETGLDHRWLGLEQVGTFYRACFGDTRR